MKNNKKNKKRKNDLRHLSRKELIDLICDMRRPNPSKEVPTIEEAEKEQTGVYPRGYINSFYATVEQWRIDDGSFVKLRELSLSYSFGKLKWFKDITASVTGRNLISWDNYKGYDPEVNAGGQSTILRGIDFGSVPIPKTFSIGISAKF